MNKQLFAMGFGCLISFTVTGAESPVRPVETIGYSPVGVAIWNAQYPDRETDVYGLRLYGGAINHKHFHGLDLGVGFAYANEVTGAQLGLGVNWVENDMSGIQIAGLVNMCNAIRGSISTASGLQLACLMNFAGCMDGIQITGLLNCASRLEGLQLAVVNVAPCRSGASSGIQIGLYNSVLDDNFAGIQLGLLNHKASSPFPYLPFLRIVAQ
jgi:hypothetical protein